MMKKNISNVAFETDVFEDDIPNNILSATLEHLYYFSRLGDQYTEARPIHLALRRVLPIRPWYRLPGVYRYMRPMAGEGFRSFQNHANQERAPDRVRSSGSPSRDLRQYCRYSEILQLT